MPVFDQGYQHWQGRRAGHAWRWLAIARQGIRSQIKNRWTKYVVILSLSPALALVVFLAMWGLLEQRSDAVKPFLFVFQGLLPGEVLAGPRAFRPTIWTVAFHVFYSVEVWVAVVLVLLVGPDLISQDLRYNATPLYLSRPLRRRDYFLGKLAVIVGFVGAVTVLPAALAYVVGVAFSLEWGVVADTWRVGLGAIAFGFVVAVSSGLLMLAFSSLSKNSRQVAMLWIGLILVGDMVAYVLSESVNRFDAEKPWRAASYLGDLHRVQEVMLGTEAAMGQLDRAFKESFLAARRLARGPFFPMPGRGLRLFRGGGGEDPHLAEQPPWMEGYARSGVEPDPNKTLPFLAWLRSDDPAPLAGAVLAGLGAISLAVLSSRIKSLDRLR
jgi:ABC-2 type transport system permease protein